MDEVPAVARVRQASGFLKRGKDCGVVSATHLPTHRPHHSTYRLTHSSMIPDRARSTREKAQLLLPLRFDRWDIDGMEAGPLWTQMDAQQRCAANQLRRDDVPAKPGVYAWYRKEKAVYAGRAIGRGGLRDRICKEHLSAAVDLSRSSFRRNVCEHLGIAPPAITRQRPPRLTVRDVEPINAWIRECAVAWIECASDDEARRLERHLMMERRPPLSRR